MYVACFIYILKVYVAGGSNFDNFWNGIHWVKNDFGLFEFLEPNKKNIMLLPNLNRSLSILSV